MVDRLSSKIFMGIGLIIMGAALLPIVRFALGIDDSLEIQFLTFTYLLIAGLMCALTAMLLILKRQRLAELAEDDLKYDSRAVWIHASGLLIFTGIPLANFLACFYLWEKYRHQSPSLDQHGREALCFQVTMYLYLLLCLFMVMAIFGLFALPLIFVYHLIATLIASILASQGKLFRYPANISIIDRGIDSSKL